MLPGTKAFHAVGRRGKGGAMPSVRTLVFGGNGRLAGSLRHYLPDDTCYAARTASAAHCTAVGDYAAVSPALFAGVERVINCAGIVAGDATALRRANVDAPVHLATMARAAGVQRFVHVSSFSVFGRARHIDARTPVAPANLYGHSKLAGENALLALSATDFAVTPLRLPAIVGGGERDKLRRLVALWLRLRRLPVPRAPIERSMISIDLAARVLADVAYGDEQGVLLAADRHPFTYREAAAVITEQTGRAVGVLTLPDAMIGSLERVVPALFASLYAPSVLALADNRAGQLSSDLYQTIARLAQQEYFT